MSTSPAPPGESKYAWQAVEYSGLPVRPGSERVADSREIYGLFDESTAQAQASRCIQCPNPSCISGCPLCNPIPQWVRLTAEGKFDDAARLLNQVTSVADICVRLCPNERLCEQSCLLNGRSDPVSIAALEQFLVEYGLAHNLFEPVTPPPTRHRVAIVGSGPGGLACAGQLAGQGHAVTVFEPGPILGGMLANETPGFKVDRAVVDRRVAFLNKCGVSFKTGVRLGTEVTLARLRATFDAVYLALDLRQARSVLLPGAELQGVYLALGFLHTRCSGSPAGAADVRSRSVVVWGGDELGVDCARIAVRSGARQVTCLVDEDEAKISCCPHDYRNSIEEGVRFVFGAHLLAMLGNENGSVSGVRCLRNQGAEEFECEADLVILSAGLELAPLPDLGGEERELLTPLGTIAVDLNQHTQLDDVYAGGDAVRGPCMVLQAVRDARRAATAINSRLESLRNARGSAASGTSD